MNNTHLTKNIIQCGIVGAVYVLFLWIAYRYLPFTYYFHDEWRQLAHVMIYGVGYEIQGTSIVALMVGKGRILGTFINNIFYYYFPFEVGPFILFSLIVHFINSILVFRITNRIIKQFWPAFFAGLFFAVSFRHEQALSWVGASVQMIGSLFFLLMSLDFFLSYITKKSKRNLVVSAVFFYTSYLFKESVLFFPIVLVVLIASRQILAKKVNKTFLFSTLILFIIGIPLAFRLFGRYTTNTQGYTGSAIILKQFVNSIFYPLVTFGQYVLPYRFIYRAAAWVLMMWYPFMNTGGNIESLLHFPLADMVSLFASSILLIGITVVFVRYKKIRFWIYAGFVYYVLSFLPIAFHLIHRYDTQIESRFVYTTTPAVAFLFACVLSYVLGLLRKMRPVTANITQVLLVLSLILINYKIALVTQREVGVSAYEGKAMTGFISRIKNTMPKLSNNTIVYFESDRTYFYDNNILPFKLGNGYVLSILYYFDGYIPEASLLKEPLLDFGSQGIVKGNGKIFGYYQNKEMLKNDCINKHVFSANQVRAFRFISNADTVIEITEEIRNYLLSP
jgi:hypothetical protein